MKTKINKFCVLKCTEGGVWVVMMEETSSLRRVIKLRADSVTQRDLLPGSHMLKHTYGGT